MQTLIISVGKKKDGFSRSKIQFSIFSGFNPGSWLEPFFIKNDIESHLAFNLSLY